MSLFLDTANLEQIKEVLSKGFIDGITTNPSLISKEKKGKINDNIAKIIQLVQDAGKDLPLSVEVFTMDPDEMIKQATAFVKEFKKYKELYIKVPIGWNELRVVRELSQKGIRVNCTACMTISQAVLAAKAGAHFVSIFWGRVRDGGSDPFHVVQETRAILDREKLPSQIIIGSIRKREDVEDGLRAGAHIVTVPFRFLKEMTSHPKTTEVVDQFIRDISKWMAR